MKILHGKRILIISPEPWSHNFLSKHHFALALIREDNDVYFLNPPSKKNEVSKILDNLFVIDYKPVTKGLNRIPWVIAAKIFQREAARIEKICRKLDVVWSFDPYRFQDLTVFRTDYRIYYAADWHKNKRLESRAANSAQIVLSPSKIILESIATHSKKLKINHGVADYFFDRPRTPYSMPGRNIIKAAYVGNLQSKVLDFELLIRLVKENPSCDFVFIGKPEGEIFETLKNEVHAYFIGVVNNEMVPAVLYQTDILLLCYDTNKYWREASNAHKIMEYLAIGRVIVSTRMAEYPDLPDLLTTPELNRMLPDLFRRVAANLVDENSSEKMKVRKAYARANTYDCQIRYIDQLLAE